MRHGQPGILLFLTDFRITSRRIKKSILGRFKAMEEKEEFSSKKGKNSLQREGIGDKLGRHSGKRAGARREKTKKSLDR